MKLPSVDKCRYKLHKTVSGPYLLRGIYNSKIDPDAESGIVTYEDVTNIKEGFYVRNQKGRSSLYMTPKGFLRRCATEIAKVNAR